MFKFSFKASPTLRVLMYHKVSNDGYNDYLTVPVNTFEAQLNYLQQQGYSSISLSELVKHVRCGKKLPPKPVLITFDDGYRDNYTIMYPVLKKYGMKANIFLVPSFLENEQEEPGTKGEQYLRLSDIQAMDKQLVEYGLHSFDHKSYKMLSAAEMDRDIVKTRARLIAMNIPFQPCLAFPYGAFPKRNPARLKEFFNVLTENKIALAFRIGNRLNDLPLQNPLLIQRLDIRGNDPFDRFVSLVRRGKSIMDKV